MSRKPLFDKRISLSEDELASIISWYFEDSPEVKAEGRTLAGIELRYDSKTKEVSADVSLILKTEPKEIDEDEVEDRISVANILTKGTAHDESEG